MAEHLSPAQIESYRQRRLAPNELLGVDDHLVACVDCRRQIEMALSQGAAELALYAELSAEAEVLPHLAFEQSAGYVDGLLTGDERQTVKDHLASCARCAMAVDDLRAFRHEIAPELDREYFPARAAARAAAPASWRDRVVAALPAPLLKLPWWVYAAAPVLLLLAAGWLVWRATPKQRPPQIVITSPTPAPSSPLDFASPTPEPMPEIAPVVAQLNDGGSSLTLDARGNLSGVDHLPPAYQQMVKQALTTRRLPAPGSLEGLNRRASPLMGEDEQGHRFSLLAPAGKVVVTDRPTFKWTPLDGAASYVVEIYDERFTLVMKSRELNDNEWTPAQPLARGRLYAWQVKASKNGRDITAPKPPAPQARFRTLARAQADEIARARRAYADSHLTLGLLYAQAGLFDEAERELRALQKANPDAAIVRRLLAHARTPRR